jgi:hypothetical protein
MRCILVGPLLTTLKSPQSSGMKFRIDCKRLQKCVKILTSVKVTVKLTAYILQIYGLGLGLPDWVYMLILNPAR